MHWSTRSALVVVVAATLSGCATTATLSSSPQSHHPGNPDGLVDAVPFALYTHCGIHELTFRGKYYVRAGGLLDDGQGNPPAGWDNPYQRGALTIFTTRALFTDAKGHRETFTLRPGARAFETVCS